MSHEITVRRSGKAEMAYVGEKPWHGLGQELAKGASIDEWKKAAGMDWSVERTAVEYTLPSGERRTWNDQHTLFRSDDGAPLGVVSENYKIVQPGECLEFFRDLTAGAGFELETAGTLFKGKRFWALARIGEEACVVGKDKVSGYLFLVSSCDGSIATGGRYTAIRVVCNNTLRMALADGNRTHKVSHRSKFDPAKLKDAMGIARGEFKAFMDAAKSLAKVKMDDAKFADFLKGLVLEQKFTSRVEQVTRTPVYTKVEQLFKGAGMGAELPGAAGTAWGALNAVTEYVDHHARANDTGNRFFNAQFGRGDALKTAALEKLLALV